MCICTAVKADAVAALSNTRKSLSELVFRSSEGLFNLAQSIKRQASDFYVKEQASGSRLFAELSASGSLCLKTPTLRGLRQQMQGH